MEQSAPPLAGVIASGIAAKSLSLRDVSDATGIPVTTLHRTLRGTRDVTVPELERIALLLGTTASALMAQAEDVAA